MTHDDSVPRPPDEVLVRDTLEQAFDTPLTSAALARGEAAVRSLAATLPAERSVVDMAGRRRRVAAAVAAGVFVLSSGAAAAGGGDPLAGVRRVVQVIVPTPASENPEVEDQPLSRAGEDGSDDPATLLVPSPSTTMPAEPRRSEPGAPVGSLPPVEQTEPGNEPSPPQAEDDSGPPEAEDVGESPEVQGDSEPPEAEDVEE